MSGHQFGKLNLRLPDHIDKDGNAVQVHIRVKDGATRDGEETVDWLEYQPRKDQRCRPNDP